MTHLELVARVANETELDETQARAALDAAFEAIVATVADGDKVVAGGFGTFKPGLTRRAPRADPKSPRKAKLVLTPSTTLDGRLNA